MFARVKAALSASGLLDNYIQQFEENSLDDSMVDHCITSKEDISYLVTVIPSAGHRLKFITEYRKNLPKPPSPSFPQPQNQEDDHELATLKALKIVHESEKLYSNSMNKYLDSILTESDLLDQEVVVKQEAINYLNENLPNSAKSEFIEQLNIDLDDFISTWFKSYLELFRLKRDEDQIVVQKVLITAKAYYNDEMDKNFLSNSNFVEPSVLSKLNDQISAAALDKALEKHGDLKITVNQQEQLKEAMKILFKKYQDQNSMRRPTKSPAIGIDLGTTFSCVAVYLNGRVEVIRNENGNNTTPSYVAFQENGSIVVGDAAKDQSYRNPQNTVFDTKRLIGRKFNDPKVQESIKSWPFEVIDDQGKPKIKISNCSVSSLPSKKNIQSAVQGSRTNPALRGSRNTADGSTAGKTFHPEEISAQILKKMKQIAEDYLGQTVEAAVVTVPALFNDSQRQATKDAAEIAGLKVLRIINEPTAASIAYRLNRLDDLRRNVLVFDLGGGTFDVAVLKITAGEIEVEAVHGDVHLGGEDFDGEMIKACIDHFQKTHRVNLARGRTSNATDKERYEVSCRLRRIRNECERQKRALSFTEKTVIGLDVIDSSHPTLDLDVPFTREMFESINQKYFDRCIQIVEEVLKEANMTKTDINDIVLVGGSTRIPKIQKMLSTFFDNKVLSKTINPDEAVAMGAAIQACILNGEQVAEFENVPLKLTDVIPFSIGIEKNGDIFSVQIPKNSRIPCEFTQRWTTKTDFRTALQFNVFEGENRIASRNNFLGKFVLSGIPARRAGREQIESTTRINEEGILSVIAICKSNKITSDIKITAYKDRLSHEEIERAKSQ